MTFFQQQFELFERGVPFVCVTLVDAIGSIPQEPGAKMLVTSQGLQAGTVGGGKLEQRALKEALALLSEQTLNPVQAQRIRYFEWALNRDIGMTCGGSVRMVFEVFNLHTWRIVVFGAGHIAQALIPMLLNLDCQVTCIDPRREWLDKLPDAPQLTRVLASEMAREVPALPDGAYVLLMTMGHGTDLPILLEILKSRQFPYLGVIGSRAKAARIHKDIDEAGLPEACKEAFYCPMGLPLGNNHPQEIAISIAAQLLQQRDAR